VGREKLMGKTLPALMLGVYVVFLSAVVVHHEPWADEAQAWLIARDSGLIELLAQRLRYEGHPALWYLVLFLPSKVLPYRAISVISVLLASLGVWVLLYRTSFPRWFRLLLPFSYFVFYQYAAIARSYVLLPGLFFLLASIYEGRHERVGLFVFLLCLLAYTSVYTALMAGCLLSLHALEFWRRWGTWSSQEKRRHGLAYAAFGVMALLLVAHLWQPEDSSFARGYHLSLSRFWRVGWQTLNAILTERALLSAIILGISLLWFWARGMLSLYVIPTLGVLFLFSAKYMNSWHEGIPFLWWATVMGLSLASRSSGRLPGKMETWLRGITTIACLVVLGFHLYWAAAVSLSDWRGSYSGGGAVARYIKEQKLEGKRIYATSFWTTAIQPYFRRNIFANHNVGHGAAYWLWALENGRMEDREQILRDAPELIVIGRPGDLRELPGYRFVGLFEGNLYWKDRIKEQNHFGVFRRKESSEPLP